MSGKAYTLDLSFVEKLMPDFVSFLETESAKQWTNELNTKDLIIKNNFSKEAIDKIDEGVLLDLIRNLWSFSGWTNKDWLVEQMLESGLPKIKIAFQELFFSDKPLAKRFDKLRKIKMMGAASISEILAHHDPMMYPIYNRRSKTGLIVLGIKSDFLPKSSQISGSQYEQFCGLIQTVFRQIREIYPIIDDLLKLDFLLHYVATVYEVKPVRLIETEEEFVHDVAIDQLLQLGDGLGFDVKKEFYVTQGCRIDAIWRSRIANLGSIAYAFEVHKRGSRDSTILNLQRCKNDPSIQKVVIVSTEEELEIFRGEISSLPEDFRQSISYFQVEDLQKALEHQEALKEILTNLGLHKITS